MPSGWRSYLTVPFPGIFSSGYMQYGNIPTKSNEDGNFVSNNLRFWLRKTQISRVYNKSIVNDCHSSIIDKIIVYSAYIFKH